MSAQEQHDPKPTFGRRLLSRWLALVVVVGSLAIVNAVYGAFCENRCEELCKREGFPLSSWNSNEGGIWARTFAMLNRKHGTCWCNRQLKPMTALSHSFEPDREIRLTFGN
jgi:hypothetical protein